MAGKRGRRADDGFDMGRLTTHVLDTANGRPAAGVAVRVCRAGDPERVLAATVTNADGRAPRPLLEGQAFVDGAYDIEFDIGAYFGSLDPQTRGAPFLDTVVVRVCLSGNADYHVPLLASPWSYTTYRGS